MTGAPPAALHDVHDVRCARTAPGLLRAYNDAGVLAPADVHVARRLAELAGEWDDAVVLGAALAVRAPRLGHVRVDLATVRATVTTDVEDPVDLGLLPWPDTDAWLAALSTSPLVQRGAVPDADGRPLRLVGSRLYLDRYWRQEREVAVDLTARSEPADGVDTARLADDLDRLFTTDAGTPDLQRLAAASAVLRRFSVIAGGPGTGKTTTVAAVLALLAGQAQAAGTALPRVALAAPTGKAAARLEEAVHGAVAHLDVDGGTRAWLRTLHASTLHRLLGWVPHSRTRFRHHRANRLPHDVVVVDETSMVALSLMARLVDAVRSGARLVLVGDPEQLASVEAGAVLGDLVGPAADGLLMRASARSALASATGHDVPAEEPPPGAVVGDGIVVLRRVHRYGGAIALLAQAIRGGDGDAAVAALRAGRQAVQWVEADVGDPAAATALAPVREEVVAIGCAVVDAASAGDGAAALRSLAGVRVLCAHRRGAYGASTWADHVERWLAAAMPGYGRGGRWYVGRPLLVTENDHGLRLYNGDTGVVVARAGGVRPTAVFERRGSLVEVSPTRLAAVETVHAMTIHKSQGSQFGTVAVLLPDPSSPILTRELLYTAVTRAERRLLVVGTEDAVRAAIGRPVARASGLREALWEGSAGSAGPPAT